jgi:nicotinate-nucleotide adenylyltransferase
LNLPYWHRWRELLDLAHIVVAQRPGWELQTGGELGELWLARRTIDARELASSLAGRVHVQPVTQLEISSTDLRASLLASHDPKFLLPDAVRQIIRETECYAPTA